MSDEYKCLTCMDVFDGASISKHLSSTRHKSVMSLSRDEPIECEDCEDNNIHQLSILRFGMNDMSLLCKMCLEKEEKSGGDSPTATYSLSNGAFFNKINQYYTFTDISCDKCQSDSNLFVAKDYKSNTVISCKNCLPNFPSLSFVGEDDDKFLYELLGLKEFIPPKNFKRGKHSRSRKSSKKGGRKGGKSLRKPRKVDPDQEARKAHYEATKETAKSIKSGSTMKAIGSGTITKNGITASKSPSLKSPVSSIPNSKVNTPRSQSPALKYENLNSPKNRKSPNPSSTPSSKSSRLPQSTSKSNSTKSGKQSKESEPNSKVEHSKSQNEGGNKKKPSAPLKTNKPVVDALPRPKHGANKFETPRAQDTESKPESKKNTGKPTNNSAKKESTKTTNASKAFNASQVDKSLENNNKAANKPDIPKKDQSTSKRTEKGNTSVNKETAKKDTVKKDSAKKESSKKDSAKQESTKKASSKKDSTTKDSKKNESVKKSTTTESSTKKQAKNEPSSKSGNKDVAKSKSKESANKSKTEESKARSTPQETTESANNEQDQSLDVIAKYRADSKPQLKYDSLDQYFRHMCFNLFIEEQLSNDDKLIDSDDMLIEWYMDDDKTDNQFKLSMVLSDIKNRFLAEKFKKLKKTPFQVGQSLFLVENNETPWYGYIATVDLVSASDNKRSSGRGRGRGGRSKGRRGGSDKNIVEMVIQLYKWNDKPLPKTTSIHYLKVLPASVPVTRVFTAMSNLDNKTFIKMLMGHEPIKQIVFKNFLKFTRDTFNDSQKVAIQSVLNNAITVLQGPPGTGKTSTIFEIILQLLDSLNTYPILVVASSNIAIDNIAEKLLPTHGKNILRIVASEKEREYNKSHPLSSICLHHKVYDSLQLKYKSMIDDIRRGTVNFGATAYKKFLSEQFEVTKVHVAQARVIFTTTVVAGSGQLKSIAKCPVVIMDEATQSSEPTTLIPLSMKGVEKFVFVGDQKQLSCFSLLPSLSLSLFERVLLNGTYKTPHMLDTQYRMHPVISEFPRNRFYGGLLKDGIDETAREYPDIPKNPVYFWDTCGKAREQAVRNRLREDRGYTFTNRGEIEFIAQVLKCLIYEKKVPKSTIGVITPYSGQRDLISSVLVKDDLINPERTEVKIEVDIDDITNDSKPVTIHLVSEIMIASIDAFQGREKDFLVMGCVRSNIMGTIGFLKDERRLNVALTRAKYGLIMIGDVKCLTKGDPLWKEYLEYLQQKNCIHSESTFNYNDV